MRRGIELHDSEMSHLFSETKYAMKEGDISESDREEMLAYFEGLIDD